MASVVFFPSDERPELAQVGGKAASLHRLASAGLPVPPGAVLTASFFEPWLHELLTSDEWSAAVSRGHEAWTETCPKVQRQARRLTWSSAQTAALNTAVSSLGPLLAVRSSSPDEDLVAASFAGGYATYLGVTRDCLTEAVQDCFASAFDARVLHYKRQQGFDPKAPSIAVVLQEQLASVCAGVSFSLNPITNDYDEIVVNAGWGLGETVVAGQSEPDQAIVDRATGAVLNRQRGSKEVSHWLRANGGCDTRQGHRSGEDCLSDDQLTQLAALTLEVEERMKGPVDVEWSWVGGNFHLLQARPITTYVPLPPEMMTAPGEPRVLYQDASLSNGLTLNVPVSPLGLDWLFEIFVRLLERTAGPMSREVPLSEALAFTAGGRLYANLSHLLHVQSPKALERSQRGVDALMAAILGHIDERRYRSARRPPGLRLTQLRRLPRILWESRGLVARGAHTLVRPNSAYERYEEDIAALLSTFSGPDVPDRSFEEELDWGIDNMIEHGIPALWSALIAGTGGALGSAALARKVDPISAMNLMQGFPGNVVVEMGHSMSALAKCFPAGSFEDTETLARRVRERNLPADVLSAWASFMDRYGARAPQEMDLASPRYRDDPKLVLSQLSALTSSDGDPEANHRRLIAKREKTCEEISRKSSLWRRLLIRRLQRYASLFAGTRDTPKHLLTLYNDRLRRKALALGQTFVDAGRLDDAEQIFGLRLLELQEARRDPNLDLRARGAQNTEFHRQLRSLRVTFPPVIDSRGRILRPPPQPEQPGELRGTGTSPGKARGRVRLLHDAVGAEIEPGDVLVAYTTDPGWTPLFVPAAAILLEIGGTLQHGALVAREFGKPCVVGIPDLFRRLSDGQEVEVDGTEGVVRLLEPADSDSSASTAS